MAIIHAGLKHVSSGLGDTKLHVLVKLADLTRGEMHLGLGPSAPTGKSILKCALL